MSLKFRSGGLLVDPINLTTRYLGTTSYNFMKR